MQSVGAERVVTFVVPKIFFAIFAHSQFSERPSVQKKKSDRRKRGAGVLVHTVLYILVLKHTYKGYFLHFNIDFYMKYLYSAFNTNIN